MLEPLIYAQQLAENARAAASALAPLAASRKNAWLQRVAHMLREDTNAIVAANALDMEAGLQSGLRTKPAQATTDEHKFTQIEINSQSVFIRVHLWFKQSFCQCRERLRFFKPWPMAMLIAES